MKRFNESVSTESKIVNCAGIVILCKNKILSVQQADLPIRSFGIPSGPIRVGESELDAALRELFEETGVALSKSLFKSGPDQLTIYSADGTVKGTLSYYTLRVDSLAEIGLNFNSVNLLKIPKLEISWAGFIPINLAYELFQQPQLIILDRLR